MFLTNISKPQISNIKPNKKYEKNPKSQTLRTGKKSRIQVSHFLLQSSEGPPV